MMLRASLTMLLMTGAIAQAQDVPSGQPVTLHEALIDDVNGQNWLRLRFIAPQIARSTGTIGYEVAEADIAHLCRHVGLPYAQEYDLRPHTIVVSLMDRAVEFGTQDAEATQFFDAFVIENGTCIWEAF